jgi:hypothetical protein
MRPEGCEQFGQVPGVEPPKQGVVDQHELGRPDPPPSPGTRPATAAGSSGPLRPGPKRDSLAEARNSPNVRHRGLVKP